MNVFYASFDEVPSFKGASTHILCELREITRHFQVTLLTLGSTVLASNLALRHIPLAIKEKNYLRRGLLFRNRVSDFFRAQDYNLAHFRGPFEGLPLVRSGIPCIYEVNAFPSIELRYHYGTLPDAILQKFLDWERECLVKAAIIVCPSERVKACVLEHSPLVNPKKIIVLPNGYDPVAPLAWEDRGQSRLRGVYIGTLAPWQGTLWSLKAFRDLPNGPALDIYAPFQKNQWQLAQRRIARYALSERVRIFPALNQAQLGKQLQTYDFALAPLLKTERNTRQGCCPLKIIDYINCGLPIVTSDLFVVRELMGDKDYPFFFKPNSLTSLKSVLEKISHERKNLPHFRHVTRQLLDRHLTWSQYGSRLCRLYQTINSSKTTCDMPNIHFANETAG